MISCNNKRTYVLLYVIEENMSLIIKKEGEDVSANREKKEIKM